MDGFALCNFLNTDYTFQTLPVLTALAAAWLVIVLTLTVYVEQIENYVISFYFFFVLFSFNSSHHLRFFSPDLFKQVCFFTNDLQPNQSSLQPPFCVLPPL